METEIVWDDQKVLEMNSGDVVQCECSLVSLTSTLKSG